MKFYTTSKISENIHETPEGFLVCVGVAIARTGDMVYAVGETPIEPGSDGKVVITRSPEEVFRPETMSSFEGKSVTVMHPSDFVNPENWKMLTKGTVTNVRRGEGEQADDLLADLLITDKETINLVHNGLREVSCGYEANYIQTERGRGIQTEIVGNHLALVDEGRAGASYAILDHKGKGSLMKLADKIAAIFAKANDEAMKVAKDATEEPKEMKKEEKSKDADVAVSLDDVMKAVKDLGEKFAGAKGDAQSQPSNGAPAAPVAKDEEVAPSLEDRLKKIESIVAMLSEKLALKAADEGEEAEASDEESEEAEDADSDCKDDDIEESVMTGDDASRVEILAPGLDAEAKGAKVKALKTAYATKDGKAVIDQLTGGKAPELSDAKMVHALFIAASELLKVKRTKDLSATRTHDGHLEVAPKNRAPSLQEQNKINADFWANR